MRRVRAFLLFTLGEVLLLGGLVGGHGAAEVRAWARRAREERAVAEALALTDLAVWTEARYTRHLSQADRFAPFQDAPGAPDLLPAGSLVPPPPFLRSPPLP